MRRNRGVVFIYPDYHCSFIYRDVLRKFGWRADVFAPWGYPNLLLFEEPDIRGTQLRSKSIRDGFLYIVRNQWLYLKLIRRYRYHIYHGSLEHFTHFEGAPGMRFWLKRPFRINLWLARITGVRVVFIPSGAPDEEMPEVILTLGNAEEGLSVRDGEVMELHFRLIRRYAHMCIGYGTLDSSQYRATHLKYKVVDLERWRPDIAIPERYLLEPTEKVRILHSFMFGSERTKVQGGNIKGTRYVLDAVEKLQSEGYNVEVLGFEDIPSSDYRYLQVQSDIVVEELIRGSWGSTAIESLALGKPVITFIRPEWASRYCSLFPEAEPLPFVNANKRTIYECLKGLLDNPREIDRIGSRSRMWAELHLNPTVNVPAFIKAITSI